MKILNIGSINIDYVYEVDDFVTSGETIPSKNFQTFLGGKGLNQSVSLAHAGAKVYHAGNINSKDNFIIEELKKWNVNTKYINEIEESTGHAIIQINKDGENSIIIHGGANRKITSNQIDSILENFNNQDILLIQNEINKIPEIINKASERGMKIFFNPAPMTNKVSTYPISLIDCLIVNESEANKLTGIKGNNNQTINSIKKKYPNTTILLTLGKKGSIYFDKNSYKKCKAVKVKAIDTTAAGDTFIGYFLTLFSKEKKLEDCLKMASIAAAKCVTKKGGAISIPKNNCTN